MNDNNETDNELFEIQIEEKQEECIITNQNFEEQLKVVLTLDVFKEYLNNLKKIEEKEKHKLSRILPKIGWFCVFIAIAIYLINEGLNIKKRLKILILHNI